MAAAAAAPPMRLTVTRAGPPSAATASPAPTVGQTCAAAATSTPAPTAVTTPTTRGSGSRRPPRWGCRRRGGRTERTLSTSRTVPSAAATLSAGASCAATAPTCTSAGAVTATARMRRGAPGSTPCSAGPHRAAPPGGCPAVGRRRFCRGRALLAVGGAHPTPPLNSPPASAVDGCLPAAAAGG
ncbi:hypothetical protein I4F81_011139 [Pyropia yezoensis]|uniref:Uncharacterized protein n=1 Tax=Pyropia yezoensis TaxID=2788 RepID=A0ACC3CFD2_PYRYE|nr:hypothetical protein I4F81_011139 [Neopyropia yezoensis]